ncbi:hypothetical protein [Methanobacterium sp.]|uniref:hypothetical protein n=1 Tax=Methanobacterium sp. TaxID=2164 RepID=UPI002ABB8477|nr:hypothetical protein [Methanobacterium sp.]MDY9922320.1 hypothetical protein [Methanobacterium sp.]
MASMCSNPDCSNIKRVEGVCPECGSPAKDLGFKEGTALIKLKKEKMNRREDEAQGINVPEMDDVNDEDDKIETINDETEIEVTNTAKGINSPILKILVFIGVVIVFYMLFRLII